MFILSSIAIGLEFWSVNHTSICENSELKVLQNFVKFLGEILVTNVYKTLESCW